MVAPLVPAAVPARATELVGSAMVWVLPALTVGGVLAGLTVMVTLEVSASPSILAITRKDPADEPAVNRPPAVTVPPVAENATLTAVLSPVVVRP